MFALSFKLVNVGNINLKKYLKTFVKRILYATFAFKKYLN